MVLQGRHGNRFARVWFHDGVVLCIPASIADIGDRDFWLLLCISFAVLGFAFNTFLSRLWFFLPSFGGKIQMSHHIARDEGNIFRECALLVMITKGKAGEGQSAPQWFQRDFATKLPSPLQPTHAPVLGLLDGLFFLGRSVAPESRVSQCHILLGGLLPGLRSLGFDEYLNFALAPTPCQRVPWAPPANAGDLRRRRDIVATIGGKRNRVAVREKRFKLPVTAAIHRAVTLPRREEDVLQECVLLRILLPGRTLESFNDRHENGYPDDLNVTLVEGIVLVKRDEAAQRAIYLVFGSQCPLHMHGVRIVDHVPQQWPSMREVVTEIGRGCEKVAGHDLGGDVVCIVLLVVFRIFCRCTGLRSASFCRCTGLRSASRWGRCAFDEVYTESSCAEDRWICKAWIFRR